MAANGNFTSFLDLESPPVIPDLRCDSPVLNDEGFTILRDSGTSGEESRSPTVYSSSSEPYGSSDEGDKEKEEQHQPESFGEFERKMMSQYDVNRRPYDEFQKKLWAQFSRKSARNPQLREEKRRLALARLEECSSGDETLVNEQDDNNRIAFELESFPAPPLTADVLQKSPTRSPEAWTSASDSTLVSPRPKTPGSVRGFDSMESTDSLAPLPTETLQRSCTDPLLKTSSSIGEFPKAPYDDCLRRCYTEPPKPAYVESNNELREQSSITDAIQSPSMDNSVKPLHSMRSIDSIRPLRARPSRPSTRAPPRSSSRSTSRAAPPPPPKDTPANSSNPSLKLTYTATLELSSSSERISFPFNLYDPEDPQRKVLDATQKMWARMVDMGLGGIVQLSDVVEMARDVVGQEVEAKERVIREEEEKRSTLGDVVGVFPSPPGRKWGDKL